MLMVVTVIYLPVMLPVLLPGASVSPWDIAKSLIFSMLLPLGIGLFIKARYSEMAASLQPHMSQISSLAIVLMLVTILVLEFSTIMRRESGSCSFKNCSIVTILPIDFDILSPENCSMPLWTQ